ncbi:MAG: site-specific integrase, partial [Gluconacetobacter diazotrophicus]|nr:site-specific integrase [Gluconacetobacter diazotrophicus]
MPPRRSLSVPHDPPPAAPDPLAEAFCTYLENERDASRHTVGNYARALAAFRAATPGAPGWLECDTEPFREYLFQVMKRGQSRAYVRLQFA